MILHTMVSCFYVAWCLALTLKATCHGCCTKPHCGWQPAFENTDSAADSVRQHVQERLAECAAIGWWLYNNGCLCDSEPPAQPQGHGMQL
jgi:hypothetical protein